MLRGDGRWLRVEGVETRSGKRTVYNLEVEGWHTYVVGGLGAWVHNAPCNLADEVVTLLHGTDAKSAQSILKRGLDAAEAVKRGGGDVFWAVDGSNAAAARTFADANPMGGKPAVVAVQMSKAAFESFVRRGAIDVDTKNFGYAVYSIASKAWSQVSKVSKFSLLP